MGLHSDSPKTLNNDLTPDMNERHQEFKRHIAAQDHCILLGMLYYDERKPTRGEYYLDLAKQHFEEAVKQARSGHTLAGSYTAASSGAH
jgi:hypothetical protein